MSVLASVEGFLEGCDLGGRDVVYAEVARALARQLDQACEAGTARGLSAAPPIASRLVEVMGKLEAADRARAAEGEVAALLGPLVDDGRG